jgi:hypothetical protein
MCIDQEQTPYGCLAAKALIIVNYTGGKLGVGFPCDEFSMFVIKCNTGCELSISKESWTQLLMHGEGRVITPCRSLRSFRRRTTCGQPGQSQSSAGDSGARNVSLNTAKNTARRQSRAPRTFLGRSEHFWAAQNTKPVTFLNLLFTFARSFGPAVRTFLEAPQESSLYIVPHERINRPFGFITILVRFHPEAPVRSQKHLFVY